MWGIFSETAALLCVIVRVNMCKYRSSIYRSFFLLPRSIGMCLQTVCIRGRSCFLERCVKAMSKASRAELDRVPPWLCFGFWILHQNECQGQGTKLSITHLMQSKPDIKIAGTPAKQASKHRVKWPGTKKRTCRASASYSHASPDCCSQESGCASAARSREAGASAKLESHSQGRTLRDLANNGWGSRHAVG